MDGLQRWRDTPCDAHLVEPNSTRGKAMGIGSAPGCPSRAFSRCPARRSTIISPRRALQLFIRQRKHALFLKSEHSAYIARVLTSLMATCPLCWRQRFGVSGRSDQSIAPRSGRPPRRGLPWTYQSALAPPEATRRQARAIWARAGSPFHIAACAAPALTEARVRPRWWATTHKRPCESLVIIIQ